LREGFFETIDCRMFHGDSYGHVGLHHDYQKEYLVASNRKALQAICHKFTQEVVLILSPRARSSFTAMLVSIARWPWQRRVLPCFARMGAKVRLIQSSTDLLKIQTFT